MMERGVIFTIGAYFGTAAALSRLGQINLVRPIPSVVVMRSRRLREEAFSDTQLSTEVEKMARGLVKFATAVTRLVCPDLLG